MARSIIINVIANASKYKQGLDEASQASSRFAAGVSSKFESVGKTWTRTLTPAFAAIGTASAIAFKDFDNGADTLRSKTGAVGAELDKLTQSMKRVSGTVTQGLGEVGTVMADVATRTGLTGPPLEKLTKQLLDLNRMGQALTAESATRLFGDWGVEAAKSTEALDRLFRTSQVTGPSIDRLAQLMVKFGAPMRQLGFDFNTAAVLLGKFEKEGVNTELVLGSMRIALAKIAAAKSGDAGVTQKAIDAQAEYNDVVAEFGEESPQAAAALEGLEAATSQVKLSADEAKDVFKDYIDKIKNAGSTSEANALALELFGRRAGPDMAAAVREGRFEIGALFDQVANGRDTVAAAAKDTLDWSDKLAMLKNRVVGVIGPFGEAGMAIGGIGAGIGPALTGLGKLGPMMTKTASLSKVAFVAPLVAGFGLLKKAMLGAAGVAKTAVVGSFNLIMAHPIIAGITAIIAVLAVLQAKFDWIGKTAEALAAAWSAVSGAMAQATSAAFGAMRSVVNGFFGFFSRSLSTGAAAASVFAATVAATWSAVSGVIQAAVGVIQAAIAAWVEMLRSAFSSVVNALEWLRDRITQGFGAIASTATWLADRVVNFVGIVQQGFAFMGDGAEWLRDRVVAGFRSLAGGVASVGNGLANTLGWLVDRANNAADAFVNAWQWVRDRIGDVTGGIRELIAGLAGFMQGAFRGAANAVIGVLNGIVRAVNVMIRGYNAIPLAPNIPSIPSIPYLAQGAILTGPTMFVGGEAGPEAVLPLSRLDNMLGRGAGPDDFAVSPGSGDTYYNINVTVEGTVVAENDLVEAVHRGLLKRQRRTGTLQFS